MIQIKLTQDELDYINTVLLYTNMQDVRANAKELVAKICQQAEPQWVRQ